MNGNLVNDTVGISENDYISNFQFVRTASGSSIGSNTLDCIVGMAPSTGGYRGDSFPLRLISTGLLSSQVVSYYIDSTSLSGELIFGGADTTKYYGSISWLPKYPQNSIYWSTFIGNITIPSNSSANIYVNTTLTAVFDSGTTLALFPLKTAASINTYLNATVLQNSGGSVQYQLSSSSCKNLASLPNITLSIGGSVFTLTPNDYLWTCAQNTCCTLFIGQDVDFMLLGNYFLKKYYTIFDYGKCQIGFALSTGAAAGSASANLSPVNSPSNNYNYTTTSQQQQQQQQGNNGKGSGSVVSMSRSSNSLLSLIVSTLSLIMLM